MSASEGSSMINNSDIFNNSVRDEGKKLRKKLRYHFLNPYQKWVEKRRFPGKLLLQFVKIILVTAQLAVFGFSRMPRLEFLETSSLSFKHLFLKGWDATYEVPPYPPTTGEFAIYLTEDFYDAVNHAVAQFSHVEDLTVGPYKFDVNSRDVKLSMRFHNNCSLNASSTTRHHHHISSDVITRQFSFNPTPEFDVKEYLLQQGFILDFLCTEAITVQFDLSSIHISAWLEDPDCFKHGIQITYDNANRDGRLLTDLTSDNELFDCDGDTSGIMTGPYFLSMILDVVLMVLSLLSTGLCVRSMVKARILRQMTDAYFTKQYGYKMSVCEHLQFVDLWFVLIIINDLLIIVGSLIKLLIDYDVYNKYEACNVLLGTGNLLAWLGILRYMTLFSKYNLLLVTIKLAMPSFLRFLVCAGAIYVGFVLCGWLVLGPYHLKFRTLSSTSEALFAMMNGDEVYMTFANVTHSEGATWWFSRAFFYLFVSLFIYVVVSVFISLLMDSYETVKEHYRNGLPKSELQRFIDGPNQDRGSSICSDDSSVASYDAQSHSGVASSASCCCPPCWGSRRRNSQS